ncbi:DUF5916 domain-containing protein [Gillisia limnaea]|uniref:DUF5916 domain-containing protein n=1 Tax=Gillisia limnaea (strain DSM 15749 / LMG 21470 / R-8282) TaxID=865937 RepID=H2BWY4_GILLR|nr:DUF5916 domain-containing protein [Gillisia limnaea]EHQ04157.1 hypothetical protein Gilli_3560 [Gillisia limnaea DSM 15749]
MIFKNLVFIASILIFINLKAQDIDPNKLSKKEYSAQRITEAPKINGFLNDPVWEGTPIATNFLMVEPGDGNPSRETHRTQVKIVYDDEAIYIAAYMLVNEPDRILRQFTQRDNIGQADFFQVDVNTYNDGENQTRFIITSAGTLADAKMSGENEDYSYNVVWEGEISYDDKGWYAELKIPYAALRFPKKEEQLWGLQMNRKITHLNETYSWNYIDKSVGKITQHNGLLRGIKNIDPPIRLSFYPYSSIETDQFEGNNQTNFNAGMDFKYGITDAFTLDATLIPDFGQTAFDNVELNLGPFEQAFGENRAFFTEGTELFTKGNLFYSRRIGDSPIGFNQAQRESIKNEVLIENPEKADLLNAIKISGRTENDLGIGFFNAITKETRAIFQDTVSGDFRYKVTEPLANYSIVVLDQQFNQNSSISLINTNVVREGRFRDGNVTGFLFDVFNNSNSFNFNGEAKMSNVNKPGQNITGFASNFEINRTKGNFRYGVKHDFANETYDINDLGLNFRNNYNNFFWNTSYQIFEPIGKLNRFTIQIFGNHTRRYKPDLATGTDVGGSFFAVMKNRFAFGGSAVMESDFKDFFEPRREGHYITYKKSLGGETWISSDYRKKFALDARISYRDYFDSDQENYRLRLSPRFRFNDKISFIYSLNYSVTNSRNSFVALKPEDIIFGNRDTESVENSLQGSYNFNTKQALNLSFRNFWSVANFAKGQFKSLQDKGEVTAKNYPIPPNEDPNVNFNIWNLDLSYSWQFAPGSEAILLYRNSIFNLSDQSQLGYEESLERLFEQSLRQNLSLRVVYFIDYNNIRNIFKS